MGDSQKTRTRQISASKQHVWFFRNEITKIAYYFEMNPFKFIEKFTNNYANQECLQCEIWFVCLMAFSWKPCNRLPIRCPFQNSGRITFDWYRLKICSQDLRFTWREVSETMKPPMKDLMKKWYNRRNSCWRGKSARKQLKSFVNCFTYLHFV